MVWALLGPIAFAADVILLIMERITPLRPPVSQWISLFLGILLYLFVSSHCLEPFGFMELYESIPPFEINVSEINFELFRLVSSTVTLTMHLVKLILILIAKACMIVTIWLRLSILLTAVICTAWWAQV